VSASDWLQTIALDCIECHASHPLGTQWCPTRCGVPLTPWGVFNRIAFYACKAHRRGELLRYGWTPTQFEEVRRKENGPSVNALTVKRHADGVLPDMRHGKLRKTNITAPMASSVESERVNVPAAAAHCTVPVAHLVPAADVEATLEGQLRAELKALCAMSRLPITNGFIKNEKMGPGGTMSIKVTLSVTSGTTNIALSVKESECLNGSSTKMTRSCGSMANVVTNSLDERQG
jgi:hypothetical protein